LNSVLPSENFVCNFETQIDAGLWKIGLAM